MGELEKRRGGELRLDYWIKLFLLFLRPNLVSCPSG